MRADLRSGEVEPLVESADDESAGGSAVGLATPPPPPPLPPETSINDVTVTRDAAEVTDSFDAVLYRIPIAGDGAIGVAEPLALTGDLVQVPGFNSNGIAAATSGSRARLVLAQSADPDGANADGLVLPGRTLYVVQNEIVRVDRR